MILCLPKKFDKNTNIERVSIVLKMLLILSCFVFTTGISKDENLECESTLQEIDGYELLFYYFIYYPQILFKQYIAIIIANFHMWIGLPTSNILLGCWFRKRILAEQKYILTRFIAMCWYSLNGLIFNTSTSGLCRQRKCRHGDI
jgi:hypothetical protein